MMADVTGGLPLGFKTAAGSLRSRPLLEPMDRETCTETFTTEARQASHHFKEAVVQEGGQGASWRMTSDEGAHLNGTDLAPFPLGFFNAGLQADLAGRVAQLAKARAVPWMQLVVGVSTRYALTGSFVQGTGQGFAEAVGAHVAFQSTAPDAELAALVREAVAQSPAFDLITRPLENTFALYCNGRRRNTAALPASGAAAPTDPFLKYAKAPAPLPGSEATGVRFIVKTGEKTAVPTAATASTSPQPPGGRTSWSVNGEGAVSPASGLFQCMVAHDRPGSSHFAFVADETGAARAPTGLSLISAGVAFCYMTQLSRYIDAMKLAIGKVRLVQLSPYALIAGNRAQASPCDTHLFMQGGADEAVFERLQLIAANTCYLHRTMVLATPLKVTAANGTRQIL